MSSCHYTIHYADRTLHISDFENACAIIDIQQSGFNVFLIVQHRAFTDLDLDCINMYLYTSCTTAFEGSLLIFEISVEINQNHFN